MPLALKERLEGASNDANRSLNGEIIARLEQSFEQPAASQEIARLQERSEHLREILKKVTSELAAREQLASAQQTIIATVGMYLREMASRLPEADAMKKIMVELGNSLVHGDYKAAQLPVIDIAEMGVRSGILERDPETGAYSRTERGEEVAQTLPATLRKKKSRDR